MLLGGCGCSETQMVVLMVVLMVRSDTSTGCSPFKALALSVTAGLTASSQLSTFPAATNMAEASDSISHWLISGDRIRRYSPNVPEQGANQYLQHS